MLITKLIKLDLKNLSASGTKSNNNLLQMEPHYPASGVRVLTICFGVTDTTLLSKKKMYGFDIETDQKLEESLHTLPWQR